VILRRIVLKNFRQFIGEQEICLLDSTNPDKNVVVIQGENGRGKTGLFRALMFCLFSDKLLQQDAEVAMNEINLVNTNALFEAGINKPIDASVEVEFEHRGTRYSILRSLKGVLTADRGIVEEDSEVRAFVFTEKGNAEVISTDKVEELVNSIINRRVKDFFLFDGEKIENLTRAGITQKKEVQKGIRNLLDIDVIEKSINVMKALTKKLEKDLEKNSSSELSRYLKTRVREESDIEDYIETLKDIDTQTDYAKEEKEILDKRLDQFKMISNQLKRRSDVERSLSIEKKRKADLLSRICENTFRAAFPLVKKELTNTFEKLDTLKKKGEIPPEIKRELIDKIIEEDRCICGRSLKDHKEAYSQIIEWRNKIGPSFTQQYAYGLWVSLSTLVPRIDEEATNIRTLTYEFSQCRHRVEELRQELQRISEEIGSVNREDITQLESTRNRVNDKIIELEAKRCQINEKIEDKRKSVETLSAKIEEEKKNEAINRELAERATISRMALVALIEVYKEFTIYLKDALGKESTDLMNKLLDEKGKETLRKIVVKEDYSLEIRDKWGQTFLANISAGQRQIISIAFIAALAKLASTGEFVDMPLFMDSPFGRLSSDHRNNLIKEVPSLCSQWILLTTDTEFRTEEAELLSATGKWCRFFKLLPEEGGNTVVKEITSWKNSI